MPASPIRDSSENGGCLLSSLPLLEFGRRGPTPCEKPHGIQYWRAVNKAAYRGWGERFPVRVPRGRYRTISHHIEGRMGKRFLFFCREKRVRGSDG
jgi:hypothetical protein